MRAMAACSQAKRHSSRVAARCCSGAGMLGILAPAVGGYLFYSNCPQFSQVLSHPLQPQCLPTAPPHSPPHKTSKTPNKSWLETSWDVGELLYPGSHVASATFPHTHPLLPVLVLCHLILLPWEVPIWSHTRKTPTGLCRLPKTPSHESFLIGSPFGLGFPSFLARNRHVSNKVALEHVGHSGSMDRI